MESLQKLWYGSGGLYLNSCPLKHSNHTECMALQSLLQGSANFVPLKSRTVFPYNIHANRGILAVLKSIIPRLVNRVIKTVY